LQKTPKSKQFLYRNYFCKSHPMEITRLVYFFRSLTLTKMSDATEMPSISLKHNTPINLLPQPQASPLSSSLPSSHSLSAKKDLSTHNLTDNELAILNDSDFYESISEKDYESSTDSNESDTFDLNRETSWLRSESADSDSVSASSSSSNAHTRSNSTSFSDKSSSPDAFSSQREEIHQNDIRSTLLSLLQPVFFYFNSFFLFEEQAFLEFSPFFAIPPEQKSLLSQGFQRWKEVYVQQQKQQQQQQISQFPEPDPFGSPYEYRQNNQKYPYSEPLLMKRNTNNTNSP